MSDGPYVCSFCDKAAAQVRILIKGDKGYICDGCVLTCTEMLSEKIGKDWQKKARSTRSSTLKNLFLLPLEEAKETFILLKMLKDERVITQRDFLARSRQLLNKSYFKEIKEKLGREVTFRATIADRKKASRKITRPPADPHPPKPTL